MSDTNDQDVSINKNYYITLCGTCPEVPYNIATHFCIDCKENICGDCSNGHIIFRLTTDHDISPFRGAELGGWRGAIAPPSFWGLFSKFWEFFQNSFFAT